MSAITTPLDGAGAASTGRPPRDFDIEAYYDGACPVCSREVDLLRRLDRRGRLRFTDIAAEGFDAAAVGVPLADLMDRIHARLPDGTLVQGVEVFRHLYQAVGYRWLVALTRLPGVSQLLDLAYRAFARNRLRLTGRCVARRFGPPCPTAPAPPHAPAAPRRAGPPRPRRRPPPAGRAGPWR